MSYKMPTKAVITDAGFASRFLPITKTIPKAMIPLGAKPIMQYVVEECVAGGIKDITSKNALLAALKILLSLQPTKVSQSTKITSTILAKRSTSSSNLRASLTASRQ